MTHMIEAECRACDGNGRIESGPAGIGYAVVIVERCQPCNGTGWLECPNKGGVDCPHPQQCICEEAWDRQEQDKAEDAA